MKVYSNLMNNNSKINASEVAYKDSNNKIYTLKEILEKKSAMTISSNTTQSLSANTSATISLPNLVASVGNKLSHINNCIVIGSGVNHVKVCGNVQGNTNSRAWFTIMHTNSNDTQLDKQDSLGFSGSDYYHSWAFPEKLIEVSEGDKLYITGEGKSSVTLNASISNLYATYLTVEVID